MRGDHDYMNQDKLFVEIFVDKKIVASLVEEANAHCGYWCAVVEESEDTDFDDVIPGTKKIWIKFSIRDNEDWDVNKPGQKEQKVLSFNSIRRGLAIMAGKYPHRFADVIKDNCDAETADVFLQCCLLGDVEFG